MTDSATAAAAVEDKATVAADFSKVSSTFAGSMDDPHPLYKELRQTHPVMEGDILATFGIWSQAGQASPEHPIYTLFKYQDVTTVLVDPRTYTSGLLIEQLGTFLGRFLMTGMDGEEHKMLRAMLAPCFAPPVVASMRAELVGPLARREYVDVIRPKGRSDLLVDILMDYPVRAIYAIMGFPNDPEEIEQFAAWALRILAGPETDPEKAAAAQQAAFKAAQDLYDHIIKLVRQRRAEGAVTNDLIGHLLRASYLDKSLSDDEVAQILRQFLPAAAETTTRSFANMLVHLLQRPELMQAVRQDRSLIAKAMHETMRIEAAPQFLARECARDVEIRGVKIPRGARLSLSTSSASRDEDVFADSDVFDLTREQRPNFGFGFGAHLCLGMPVAKMEMEVMANALLDGLPNLRLDPDAPAPVIRGVQMRGADSVPVVWDLDG
jgi:cytochrome P450